MPDSPQWKSPPNLLFKSALSVIENGYRRLPRALVDPLADLYHRGGAIIAAWEKSRFYVTAHDFYSGRRLNQLRPASPRHHAHLLDAARRHVTIVPGAQSGPQPGAAASPAGTQTH